MAANPDDLVMSFYTPNGVHVEIYDTYCKNFTQEDKDRVDERINEILYQARLRKLIAAQGLAPGTGSAQGQTQG